MPRLWEASIDAHRQSVRTAAIEAAARLVAERGIRRVTMAAVALEAGIGRATLYKYFPDVESLLLAWHEVHVRAHLAEVEAIAKRHPAPKDGLSATLNAIAVIEFERPGGELASQLHDASHVDRAGEHLASLLEDLLTRCVAEGRVRADVAPDELAFYCLHAVRAARGVRSKAAVRRLVSVIESGLEPGAGHAS
jgi:AcrR family transcriptional regulator